MWRALRWVLVTGIWLAVASGGLVAWYAYDLPDPGRLETPQRRASVTLLAADGTLLASYGDLHGGAVAFDALPPYLVQAVVATITSDADAYAMRVAEELKQADMRVETDLRNEKINYKIREHSHAKVPAILVLGKQEAEKETVALRRLDGRTQEILALHEAVNRLASEAMVPPPV